MQRQPFFGDFDFTTLTIAPPITENGKTKIKITNAAGRVPYFNLVKYTNRPLQCKFPLDAPPQDGDPDRRTQTIVVENTDVHAAVKRFDEYVVSYAAEHSEKIFGKKMTKESVQQRYESMEKQNENYPGAYIKVKVKVGESKVPTKLFLGADQPWPDEDAAPKVEAFQMEESACRVSPICSMPQLWVIGKGATARFGPQIQMESAYVWPGQKRSACAMHSEFAPPEMPETKKQATGEGPGDVALLEDTVKEEESKEESKEAEPKQDVKKSKK